MTSRKLPTKEELEDAYEDIARIHAEHLVQHNVILPKRNTHKSIWLAMLHHHDRAVHKDEISEAVQREHPDAGKDQQVRHLICNRSYRGDFVFDDKGRVYAVADTTPVKRASEEVQRKILDYLKRTWDN